jgi:hypothetical protein
MLGDFMSYEELGIPPRRPLSPMARDGWRGFTHYATFAAAAAAARAHPHLGRYIATVRIPDDGSIRFQQTGRDPEHVTIWAEARSLVRSVVSVASRP